LQLQKIETTEGAAEAEQRQDEQGKEQENAQQEVVEPAAGQTADLGHDACPSPSPLLAQPSATQQPPHPQQPSGPQPSRPQSLLQTFHLLTPYQRQEISCDTAFALYLSFASKLVNQEYFKVLTRFVMLYRQCLNEVGWQRRREHYLKCSIPLEHDEVYVKVLKREGKSLSAAGSNQANDPNGHLESMDHVNVLDLLAADRRDGQGQDGVGDRDDDDMHDDEEFLREDQEMMMREMASME